MENTTLIKMEKCTCGHSSWDHMLSDPEKLPFCHGCVKDKRSHLEYWHSFRLDNLQLIEELAKERNLI